MRFLGQYIWKRRRYLGLLSLFVVIFAVCFYLYRLPLAAVLYPAGLFFLTGAAVMLLDFIRVRKKHEQLRHLVGLTCDEIGTLPAAENVTEADYQAIVAALREENKALAAASVRRMDEMMDYYGTWAHQIKTPIAAMRLYLQTEDSELGRNLSGELLRIEQYADMVMAYLRLDSASSDYVFRTHGIDAVVRPAVRRFAPQFIARRIRLVYEALEGTVVTDEKWLGFVIEQLLSNALKYSHDGGTVCIYLEEPKTLCVADDGIGIAPEDMPRIFEKGYTGINGRLDGRASGIGLYLCRRICRALGVGITARSTPGQGTTVCLDLTQSALKTE